MTAPVVARSAQQCWLLTGVQEVLEQPSRLEHKSQGRARRVRSAFLIGSSTVTGLCALRRYRETLAGRSAASEVSLAFGIGRPRRGGRPPWKVLLHRKAAAAERPRLLGGIGSRV